MRDWSFFNKALLSKWQWRLLNETDSMCGRVLWAKYSIPTYGDQIVVGGKLSSWWKDILRICFEESEVCRFFPGLRRLTWEGNVIKFWEDGWIGQIQLKDMFRRLFNLSTQKSSFILDMAMGKRVLASASLVA